MKLSLELTRSTAHQPLPAGIRRSLFNAAKHSRLIEWAFNFCRINQSLKSDFLKLTENCRNFAINNEIVTGFLEHFKRNVIGANGFTLQSKTAPETARKIERLWNEYQSRSGGYVTLDERMSGRDFDLMILRNLIIDGEVFIRRAYDPSSKFGWRYELIDAFDIDPYYNDEFTDGSRIVMGIEFDPRGRERAFHLRRNRNSDMYFGGERIRIPAEHMIHIFRKFIPDQSRGYSMLAPVAVALGHMDAYKEAEIVRARIMAATLLVWEKTGADNNMLDEADKNGDIFTKTEMGSAQFAPDGYTAKFFQNTSPNSNFGAFWVGLLRSMSNAIGLSYNKANGDYTSINYSSAREATLEDRAFFEEFQNFIIENWKELQFREFLKAAALNGLVQVDDSAFQHRFFGRRFQWVDPAKEIAALEKELSLKLTDPITELEKRGFDPDEVLDRWAIWEQKCKERGIVPPQPQNYNLIDAVPPDENEKEKTDESES